jgi:hypothetical protein
LAFNFEGECICFHTMFCCLNVGVICETHFSSSVQPVAISVTTITMVMTT